MRFSLAIVLSVVVSLLTPLVLSAADPALSIIVPRGVQRGTEQVIRFAGARLDDAQEIFFYEPGFEVLEIKPADANNIDVKIRIAPDCVLGEHTAQVRTKTGISEYRTFFVGALPAVDEVEPNTDFALLSRSRSTVPWWGRSRTKMSIILWSKQKKAIAFRLKLKV